MKIDSHIRDTLHYRIAISLVIGVIGFGINLYSIHFDFPPYRACLMPGMAFPMAVAIAWGWPYGLLSASVGLVCHILGATGWPDSDWNPMAIATGFTLWMVWHGWCASRHRTQRFPNLNKYNAEIPYRICHCMALFAVFRWTTPAATVYGAHGTATAQIWGPFIFMVAEQTINAYIVLLIADTLLNLGFVQKLLVLKQRPGQMVTGYVIGTAIMFGVLFWIIDGMVDYYKFREHLRFLIFKAPESALDSILLNVSSPDLFARTAFVVTCLTGGLLVARLLQNQIEGQAALRESETRYRRLHETMSDAFVQIDMSGKIIDFNQTYQQMIGHTEEQLHKMHETDLIPSSWHDRESKIIAEQVLARGKSEVYEKEYIRHDGTVFPAEVRTFLITDEENTPLGMWAIVRDITQRKNDELDREKTLLALKRSNEDLQQFAYVASHDLQEPLRMVSSYTQLLSERYRDRLDDKACKFIHYAVDGATRMQTLIRDLLAFTRVETHAETLKTIAAHDALGRAVANLKAVIDETTTLVSTDELPHIEADETQMAQVFQNLISNAIKFHGEAPPHIHIRAQENNDHWLFSLRDNGIGIEPRFKDKVFVIFQRLHTHVEYPGTGIGLAICKRIIERHGGRIWFESTKGKGTTFYFTIPIKEK